jgi:hypothetical protein
MSQVSLARWCDADPSRPGHQTGPKERSFSGSACGDAAEAAFWWDGCGGGDDVPCRVCERDLGTPSESCRHVHAGGMAVTSEDVALMLGASCWSYNHVAQGLWVKTLSISQTSDGDTFGGVHSLEVFVSPLPMTASLGIVSPLSGRCKGCWLPHVCGGCFLIGGQESSCCGCSTACSRSRWLALLWQ